MPNDHGSKPGDEWVVERADRQERLAVPRPGRPELAEQSDEIDLGDTELDVLSVMVLAPLDEHPGIVGEPVRAVADVPDARAVDPAAQIGGGGDIGADRHHARRDLRCDLVEIGQEPSQSLLRRGVAAVHSIEIDRSRRRRGEGDRLRSSRPVARRQSSPSGVSLANVDHGSAGSVPSSSASCSHWAVESRAEWLPGALPSGGSSP